MRYFNTHGPVNSREHYVVPREAVLTELLTQIERGKYFTIYAPRQMGKTTLLRDLFDLLQEKPDYLPIPLSFELYEHQTEEAFLTHFGQWMVNHIRDYLRQTETLADATQNVLANPPTDYIAFDSFFRTLRVTYPTVKVVLIIDEFDGIPQPALSPILQTWRTMYLDRFSPHALHSVILIGIQNIARLNFGRSSPFNIAYQYNLQGFSWEEVRDLLGQYTEETGQPFVDDVIEKIYEQTGGQPFLVNRLAKIVTEAVAGVRPITLPHLRHAIQQLVKESNYNFETIVRHAAEFEDDVVKMVFGRRYRFTLNNPMINALHTQGIVREDESGDCTISNPLYKQVLIDYFAPTDVNLQADIIANGYDFRTHLVENRLQMHDILSRFRQFVERRGREAFKVTDAPQEATGQYLLMAYLYLVVRQVGGDVFTEVNSGDGVLDLIVVHQGQRFVVETKIWRGPAAFDQGVEQLASYLRSEGQDTGYFVVFHARPRVYGKLASAELEFTIDDDGTMIHTYLVRLGEHL